MGNLRSRVGAQNGLDPATKINSQFFRDGPPTARYQLINLKTSLKSHLKLDNLSVQPVPFSMMA